MEQLALFAYSPAERELHAKMKLRLKPRKKMKSKTSKRREENHNKKNLRDFLLSLNMLVMDASASPAHKKVVASEENPS